MKGFVFGMLFWGLAAGSAGAADNQETLKATVVKSTPKKASGDGFETTVCTQGNNRRIVEITSADPEKKVPCEVHYKKETEEPGNDQVLFKAQNDLTFCQGKAAEFVDKLSGWGWACGKK